MARYSPRCRFCERLATVVYLEQALRALLPTVCAYSTVRQRDSGVYEHKPYRQVQEVFEAFAPIANRAEGKHRDTYDIFIFISTDTYGVHGHVRRRRHLAGHVRGHQLRHRLDTH